MQFPKKLIEVALPLNDINAESAREKSIRHGHPSTLHLWWARRPLAAARAVLFAQLVNDPGTKAKREKLFALMRELVLWKNSNNEDILRRAQAEIRKSWEETCRLTGEDPNKMPPLHDPFAGGGAIPLEAQRLGLESHASDLNPVAVLMNKAMIEIPFRFAGRTPVGPVPSGQRQLGTSARSWPGASGLAEDVRRYGSWMRDEAQRRIGHLYPTVQLPKELGGTEATVIAWLWARTVASPDPARNGAHVPLISSFWLSKKANKQTWVEPVIDGIDSYHFEVRTGKEGPLLEETVNRKGGICLLSGVKIPFSYIRSEAKAGRMKAKLMAVVVEGIKGRIYMAPNDEQEQIAASAIPTQVPNTALPEKALSFRVQEYGMTNHRDLFTIRQLAALTTFSDLVHEARSRVIEDAERVGWELDSRTLEQGGSGVIAYADSVAIHLGIAASKMAVFYTTLARWRPGEDKSAPAFGRQSLPMVWDYAEVNPFAGAGGDALGVFDGSSKAIKNLPAAKQGIAFQQDITGMLWQSQSTIICCDPPYYDNIGYADLSDYFYIWLRRSLREYVPSLFGLMLVPKEEELVATPFRHGTKKKAETFFLNGMKAAMQGMANASHPAFPVVIYYAFKQSKTTSSGTASTGWETFLEAVIQAGFVITATWPMHTESSTRMISRDTNALASSIVLVCRKRELNAPEVSRREFLRELRTTMPAALEDMIGGKSDQSPIPPADLPQATIGPGMGVFSRYAAVLEADGSPMSVHTALTIINKEKDAYFFDAEEDLDADSRFCLTWFELHGWQAGPYGEAESVAKGRGTSVSGVAGAGVLESQRGKARLLRPEEYPQPWAPENDTRLPIWEALHYLVQAFQEGGNKAAGRLLARCRSLTDPMRHLAYRQYTYCERNGRAADARLYNELVSAWIDVETAADAPENQKIEKQLKLFGNL